MIIDFHTHVFPSFFRDQRSRLFPKEPAFEALYRHESARLVGVDTLLSIMDEEGVERSVIFGFPWEEVEHYRRHNDYILEACAKYPNRMTGFCTFSLDSPGAVKEAERCLESGLAGVGELAVYGRGLSPQVIETLGGVMDLCASCDAPVLLHTNEPVGHDYPGKAPMTLREIYEFVKAYPSNRIVLAHWGGGLPFFCLMKKEVADVLRSVWFDTAASPYLYKAQIYRFAGELVGYEKVLFGSDYPLIRPRRYFREMASAGLSREHMEQITGLNAAKLLRLGD